MCPLLYPQFVGKFNFFGVLASNIHYIRGQKRRKNALSYRLNLREKIASGGWGGELFAEQSLKYKKTIQNTSTVIDVLRKTEKNC